MKVDCKIGQEVISTFYSQIAKRQLIQLDYRDHDGELFSCVTHSVLRAKELKEQWLKKKNGKGGN